MRLNCKDFFLLLNNLVNKFGSAGQSSVPHSLEFIFAELRSRAYYEQPIVTGTHESYQEDDVLVGLLSLSMSLVRFYERTGESDQIQIVFRYIDELYGYLFDLNTSTDGLYRIQLPKFRSNTTRSLGFDLLLEFGKTSCDAYTHLYDKLMWLNRGETTESTDSGTSISPAVRHLNKNLNQIVCDYWPKDDVKSPCGYVGLANLGATCYMATAMQHLFMINEARQCILNASSDSLENKKFFFF
jgi:ubiquitin carboxyl-terminal hydrolase 34